MVNSKVIQSEKGLRVQIKRNLNKEIHPATKPSIDFIYKILTDAYESGLTYDVTDMRTPSWPSRPTAPTRRNTASNW